MGIAASADIFCQYQAFSCVLAVGAAMLSNGRSGQEARCNVPCQCRCFVPLPIPSASVELSLLRVQQGSAVTEAAVKLDVSCPAVQLQCTSASMKLPLTSQSSFTAEHTSSHVAGCILSCSATASIAALPTPASLLLALDLLTSEQHHVCFCMCWKFDLFSQFELGPPEPGGESGVQGSRVVVLGFRVLLHQEVSRGSSIVIMGSQRLAGDGTCPCLSSGRDGVLLHVQHWAAFATD